MHPGAAVVAGIDFSAISAAVVAQAVRCAARLGGPCRVLHVVDVLEEGAEAALLLPALRRRVAAERREAEEAMAALVAGLEGGPVEVVAEVAEGRPAQRLVRVALAERSALVVVGGSPPQRMLGAIAEKVVRIAPVPALVVRRPPPQGYRNLLAAVDFSPEAERALEAALGLVEDSGRVTLWHAVDPRGASGVEDFAEAARDLEARVLDWAAPVLGTRDARVVVVEGRPRKVLLEEVASREADLLAVGCRGRGRIRRLLLGSVAEAAVRWAACDVLVAGRRATPGPGP